MMKKRTFNVPNLLLIALLFAALIYCASPELVNAQCSTSPAEGNNAVWANCTSVQLKASSAFIDASVFGSTGTKPDFCVALSSALSLIPSGSASLVDARGLNSGNSSMTCARNPFASTQPATVLLPAGTIVTSAQWSLPNGTRIIGEGAGTPGDGVTTLKATSSISGLAVIRMIGTSDVSVEDLAVDGSGVSGGITNSSAQTLSYVKRVSINNISGSMIGVSVPSTASNSGPYTDITVGNSGAATCMSILGPTRGVRGLTCRGTSGSAAVLLDAPNNSLEDVSISGFTDGVKIGSRATAQSDVLLNVSGGTGVTNVVHITTTNTVSDISLLTIGSNGSTNTIRDDVTGNTLSAASGPSVTVYALGEAVTSNGTTIGHSLFSTSLSVPAWIVQTSSTGPTGSCKPGSMLSNPNGGSNTTWYVCTPSGTYLCTSGTPCWTIID